MATADCRFYEKEYPLIDTCVMVQVVRVMETAAYCKLLEYNGIEGMILLSEVSQKRIRSLIKEIRVGQFVVCLVLRVDEEKGTIDLSKRRVQNDERAEFIAMYSQSKMVHSALRQLSNMHQKPMLELCEKVSWPLYKQFPHANDAFKQYVNDGKCEAIDNLDLDDNLKKILLETIKRKLAPQATKLKAKIEVTCFEYAGIEAVKESLMAGLDTGDEIPEPKEGEDKGITTIAIKVVAPPHYDIMTTSMGKESGVALINNALERIEKKIVSHGGKFKVLAKPEIVGEEGAEDDEDDDDEEEDGKKKGKKGKKPVAEDDDSDSTDEEVEGMGDIDIPEN